MDNPFIIAEAGVNNNGSLEKAKKMAFEAKKCGADAVKFQTFWGIGKELKKYEMAKEEWIELAGYCQEIGIEFMSTPHWGSPLRGYYKDDDYFVIDFIDGLVKRHKVASPYLTNKKYIDYISRGKPLIISTGSVIHQDGMATMEEIKRCLNWIDWIKEKTDITLLYCISKYPSPKYDWRRIEELKRFGLPVGISDHTISKTCQLYPVIEKHFKLDDDCIDAKVSLNPIDFKKYVESIRL